MRQLTTIILLFFPFIEGFTQSSKIGIELKLGPTVSSFHGNYQTSGYDYPASLNSGLYLDYLYKDWFSFKTGLIYERKSSKTYHYVYTVNSDQINIQKVKVRNNTDYILFPIYFAFSTKGRANFFINAGPYLAYLLNSKDINTDEYNVYIRTGDVTKNYKRLDFGISTGIGVNYNMINKLFLGIEFRDDIGLININAQSEPNDGSIKTYSKGFLFGLKYLL